MAAKKVKKATKVNKKTRETKKEKGFTGIDYNALVDGIEGKLNLTSVHLSRGSYVEDVISTGSLSYDLITGGGWPPGRWITLFGPETSGKSSFLYFSMADAMEEDVFTIFFDHENSTDAYYLSRILKVENLDQILGLRNSSGDWVIPPRIRYYQADLGETTFRLIRRFLKKLPDKVQVKGEWFLVFEDTKANRGIVGNNFSEAWLKKTSRLWVPSSNGGAMQALFYIDSYPMMFPEVRDTDDEKNPLALTARMFSEQMPGIRNQLAKKRCTVVGTNQLREKPMVMYGSPEYEPCGNTPKFLSDVRVRIGVISVPHAKGPIEEETCFDGNGTDRYRYFKVRTIKNKAFSPFREITLRHWFENRGRPGSGICPVWDTFQFLKATGQLKGNMGNIRITMKGPWYGVKMNWAQFKRFILDPDRVKVFRDLEFDPNRISGKKKKLDDFNEKKIISAMDIRKKCQRQLEDSTAFEMYFRESGNDTSGPLAEDRVCETCRHWMKKKKCETSGSETCEKWELI